MPKPKRWAMVSEVEIEVPGIGLVRYGDTLAVIEANCDDPGTVARLAMSGQLRPVRIKPGMDEPCIKCRDGDEEPAPVQDEAKQSPARQAGGTSEEPKPESAPEKKTDDQPVAEHPLDVLAKAGVDQGTLDALKDPGAHCPDLETLEMRISNNENIPKIGSKRRDQITAALKQLATAQG